MAMSESGRVVRATVRLIELAREAAPSYGEGTFGRGIGYTDTKTMAELLGMAGAEVHERRFASPAKGMAFELGGRKVIAIDTACTRSDAEFTLRHELAHILADDVQFALFLTSEDTMSFSERRADLFAVADLTPTRWMEWMRGGRRRWKLLELDVKQAFRELTDGWSEQRLNDRAHLRVQLYRHHGI